MLLVERQEWHSGSDMFALLQRFSVHFCSHGLVWSNFGKTVQFIKDWN